MLRFCVALFLLSTVFSGRCVACECLGAQKPCEYLRGDAVFAGRVIETVAVKHPVEKDSFSFGYSMRFAVDESLRGGLGSEVTIETGNGGGDCGTPLRPGDRYLIFAFRNKDGALWTGMCSGNRFLSGNSTDERIVDEFRGLTRKGTGTIFGRINRVTPIWRDGEIDDSTPRAVAGVTLHANSDRVSVATKTDRAGAYEFSDLPNGRYSVVPDIKPNLDFDHESAEDRYIATVADGQCADISFKLEPTTRIRGRLRLPEGMKTKLIEVNAIPTSLHDLHGFTGAWDLTDEHDRFDIWPLPAGDYYVGVNILSSPSEKAPFPPTYYPGGTNQTTAKVIHVKEGEVREIELPILELARPRTVHFVAIGFDGKPLSAIYVQFEDLRHPGEASSYVNVDLDNSGAGVLTVYSGYSYHLHGSHWAGFGNDWCADPVLIIAGSYPVNVRFVMTSKGTGCDMSEIDRLKK
jgi:hypothetical protein